MTCHKVGKKQIYRCTTLIPKKACENDCDFICKLNKNGGTKDMHALYLVAHEFHVTENQIKCAVRDDVIPAEIIQKKKNTIIFLEKSEVAVKLSTILSYPKNSEARKEQARNRYRQISQNYPKNSEARREQARNHHRQTSQKIQRNMTPENITLEQASKEFEINLCNIRAALDFGIIHNCEGLRDHRTKYLLSRAEIKEKLELIKKGNRMFYRILMKRQQQEMHDHIKPEIHVGDLQDFNRQL